MILSLIGSDQIPLKDLDSRVVNSKSVYKDVNQSELSCYEMRSRRNGHVVFAHFLAVILTHCNDGLSHS